MKSNQPLLIAFIILCSFCISVEVFATDACGENRPVKYADLKVMGVPLPGNVVSCITGVGNTVNSAVRGRCPGGYVVNPANPQYTATAANPSGLIAGGSLHTNPLGYFYCARGGIGRNTKNDICNVQAPARYASQGIVFNWRRLGSQGDGQCGCARSSDPEPRTFNYDCEDRFEAWMDEVDVIVVTAPRCVRRGLFRDDREFDSLTVAEREAGEWCRCEENGTNYFKLEEAQQRCAELKAALERANADQAERARQEEQARITAAQNEFKTCVTDWVALSKTCKESAEAARSTCDNNEGSATDQAGDALAALNQGVVGANAGQGTQSTCFQASAATYGAREALGLTRDRCDTSASVCNRDCGAGRVDEFLRACPAKLNKTAAELQAGADENSQYFNQHREEIRSNFEGGRTICQNEIPQRQSDLSRVFDGIGQAVQAATMCACQTSSTSSNCAAIPPIEVCATTDNPNCIAYTPASTCAVGTPSYDAKACACLQNPGTPGCTAAVVGPAANAFASLQANPLVGSTGVSGFSGSGGGTGGAAAGQYDLNGGPAETPNNFYASNLKAGDPGQTNSGDSMGGSVAGSGAGAGSVAPNSGALKELDEDGKGTIKGMFNQVKNSVMSALGLGRSDARAPVAAVPKKAEDMSKFKPNLRGAAANRGLASANEKTIFELVNDCANGIRCKSTLNSFITGP